MRKRGSRFSFERSNSIFVKSYFLSSGLSLALFDPSYTFVAENAFFVAQIGGLECKFIIFVSDCYNGPIQFSILPLLELNSFEATSRTNVLSIFSTTQIHSRTTKSFKLLPEGGTNKKWLWLEQLLPTPEVRGSSHRQKFMLNVYCQLHWKDVNKKEPGNDPFFKIKSRILQNCSSNECKCLCIFYSSLSDLSTNNFCPKNFSRQNMAVAKSFSGIYRRNKCSPIIVTDKNRQKNSDRRWSKIVFLF